MTLESGGQFFPPEKRKLADFIAACAFAPDDVARTSPALIFFYFCRTFHIFQVEWFFSRNPPNLLRGNSFDRLGLVFPPFRIDSLHLSLSRSPHFPHDAADHSLTPLQVFPLFFPFPLFPFFQRGVCQRENCGWNVKRRLSKEEDKAGATPGIFFCSKQCPQLIPHDKKINGGSKHVVIFHSLTDHRACRKH